MAKISTLAVVDPAAEIADDVEIGPFCVIGPQVRISAGCRLMNNVTITGDTIIGKGNLIYPNAVIGTAPQDKKFKGESTRLEVGEANIIREAVTIHVGTEKGGGITRLGSNNLLMVNAHVGHDAQVGSNCILANNIMLAGHVEIGNNVAMMGGSGVHHFVRIGEFAYAGAYAKITHDVPPFCKVDGNDRIRGVNAVGLKRAGYSDTDIEELEVAERALFSRRRRNVAFAKTLAAFDVQNGLNPHVRRLVQFLHERSSGKHGRYLEAMRK